jgi:hypothetical protein
MTDINHSKEVERDKLSTDEMFKKPVQTWTEEDWRQWNKETERQSKLIFVPRWRFFITTIELESGCAGVLMAEVIATLKPSTIISTEIPVRYPDFTIWSNTWTLKASHESFSKFAIESSAQMLKSFVNDWTASQSLLD